VLAKNKKINLNFFFCLEPTNLSTTGYRQSDSHRHLVITPAGTNANQGVNVEIVFSSSPTRRKNKLECLPLV
jgi:hypothetical protein